MAKRFSFEDYFNTLDKDGINLSGYCGDTYKVGINDDITQKNIASKCNEDLNCKYNTKDDANVCENDTVMDNLEFSEMTTEQLQNILLTRNRMLEVNLHKNDIKNKKIYTMFVFIIIIIIIMTIIHFKNSK